ncbi:hypothetical protein [Kitasatospora phosalacinea]|uniref:Uncharacterized protein n=1 Tax=Kitasatospora phosalacinea TaxID=2065 RepID=A0A9W6PR17_9ACTN|nr:hypothetical protein [Kitasatospora phosalacinea]GLW59556.1 hypothetical protein Kpho01_75660 [Kitasatospora phosalacinea]
MDLWDREVSSFGNKVQALESPVLTGLALGAIRSAFYLLESQNVEIFPSSRRGLIVRAIESGGIVGRGGGGEIELAERFLADYDSLPDVALAPPVGPFMMGLVRLFEEAPSGLSPDGLMEILWSCHESILMSRISGRYSIHDEELDSICNESINKQKILLESALGGA